MLIQIFILFIGLILLYYGSELLVRGAASTAVLYSVKPVIIGLTIVSLATSAPELLVSLVAAFKGSEGISLGNILGSNVINIALVLGISAIIKPVKIKDQLAKIEIPYMTFATIVFWALCIDNQISRADGWLLLFLLAVFLLYGILQARDIGSKLFPKPRSAKNILIYAIMIVAGILMLAKGADLVVQKAIFLATRIGLSQTFIGISVVALGTSLPELATSAVAASRGESDISIGNVVGSNLFNICLVIGIVGVLNPMAISRDVHFFEFPFMVLITLCLSILAFKYREAGRKTGIAFVLFFIGYILISYLK